MSRMILVLGETGTGKTSSLRNFKKDEAQVVACSGKPMPFKNDLSVFVPSGYTSIYSAIEKADAPIVVIDDLNYMMVSDEFARAKETGYGKFTDFALSLDGVFKRIKAKNTDQTFYVFAHPDDRSETMTTLSFRISAGKMSKKFPIGGLTNEVFETVIDEDGQFVFKVKTNGTGIKTPLDMFDTPTVPNDLKEVNKIISAYYAPIEETK